MKRTIAALALILLAAAAGPAGAHQPRVAGSATAVEVDFPEVSKAYYGELPGEQVRYIIRAVAPFKLYVGLLLPDVPGVETGLSAQIYRDHQPIATLDGVNFEWKPFREEYGGDDYLRGPEFSADAEAGVYEIFVFDADNSGKYVVAIGEKEEWPFSEMKSALRVLPALKKEFFGKSPWDFFSGRIGRYVLAAIVAVVVGIALVVALIVRRVRRK